MPYSHSPTQAEVLTMVIVVQIASSRGWKSNLVHSDFLVHELSKGPWNCTDLLESFWITPRTLDF